MLASRTVLASRTARSDSVSRDGVLAIGVLAALAGVFLSIGSAFALPTGCTPRPAPVIPNNTGVNTCTDGRFINCVAACQALNACWNGNTPPSLQNCGNETRALDRCLNGTASIDPSDSPLATVAWSGRNGCYLVPVPTTTLQTDLAEKDTLWSAATTRSSGATFGEVSYKKCENMVVGEIVSYFGLESAGQTNPLRISSATELRAGLGASDADMLALGSRIGSAFQVQVSLDVLKNMKTVGDVVSCIATAQN